MLIRTRVCLVAFILFVFSIVLLVFSAGNSNEANRKFYIIYSIITMLFLIIDLGVLVYALKINIGLRMLIFYAMGFVAGILCIISIVINRVKSHKAIADQVRENVPASKNVLMIMAVLAFVLPMILLGARIIRDRILIAKADLLVVFDSSGNGGMGDGAVFAYAIKGNSCKSFDMCIEYGLDELVDKSAVKLQPKGDTLDMPPYKVVKGIDSITVFNEGKQIYQYTSDKHSPFLGEYFNISWNELWGRG